MILAFKILIGVVLDFGLAVFVGKCLKAVGERYPRVGERR